MTAPQVNNSDFEFSTNYIFEQWIFYQKSNNIVM